MRTRTLIAGAALACLVCGAGMPARAQRPYAGGPQIPTLQVCNQTTVVGRGAVQIASRADASHKGTFDIKLNVTCNPKGTTGLDPSGTLGFLIDMVDSSVQGVINATTVDQLTSTGKSTPTVFMTGRCRVERQPVPIPCHYWLMIADNRTLQGAGPTPTPDVISFLVFNGAGVRIAYGTGPLLEGDDIIVSPSGS